MNDIKTFIDNEFKKIELPKEPKKLYDPIRYILASGGKRLRPKLALLACEMFGGSNNDVIGPALAIEIFHNFTLLHDDIMDNADYRRNRLTVHKKWNNNIAILSGDAMNNFSYDYLLRADTAIIKDVLKTFNDAAIDVCEGQQYDMDFEDELEVEVPQYLEMIRLKTAVLIAASLKIGALAGGATTQEATKMYDFGIKIGIAFQLQDDLLDTYGNQSIFGKRIGGDIIENKKTFLLCSALKNSDGSTKAELIQYISNNYNIPENEKIELVTEIYNKIGIQKLTNEAIESFYVEGLNVLEELSVDGDKKIKLKNYISEIMERDN